MATVGDDAGPYLERLDQLGLDAGGSAMGGEDGVRRLVFAVAPLSRVMLRHTRPLLELYRARGKLKANLAKRVVLPLQPIRFTAPEEQAYNRLEDYCTGLADASRCGGARRRWRPP